MSDVLLHFFGNMVVIQKKNQETNKI